MSVQVGPNRPCNEFFKERSLPFIIRCSFAVNYLLGPHENADYISQFATGFMFCGVLIIPT
jgi:hypothetical protein